MAHAGLIACFGLLMTLAAPSGAVALDLEARLLGGSDYEGAQCVGIGPDSTVYVVGRTRSPDFPGTETGYAPEPTPDAEPGSLESYICRLSPDGQTILSATYFGGTGDEFPYTLAVGPAGDIYVAGYTFSADLPVTVGAYDPSHNGNADHFVARFTPALDDLLACTFVGGSGEDLIQSGGGLTLDTTGNIYVAAGSNSSNFPTTSGAYDRTFGHGGGDAVVYSLTDDLSQMRSATFLGNSSHDEATGVLVDNDGRIVVLGNTYSGNFPTTVGAYDRSFNGVADAYVVRFDAALSTLETSTFVGGSFSDWGADLTLLADGRVLFTTTTESSNFPTTPGAYDRVRGGALDVAISVLDGDLALLEASTFLGGASAEWSCGHVIGDDGSILICGTTTGPGFPVSTDALQDSHSGEYDSFLTVISLDLTSMIYSTYLGGSADETAYALVGSPTGDAFLVGNTASTDHPLNFGAPSGPTDALLVQIGGFEISGVLDGGLPTGHGLQWHGAVPNPFNPRTAISFTLAESETVRLSIHDLRGREIAVVANREFAAGRHAIPWLGSDKWGRSVAAGVYLVRLAGARSGSRTGKISLIR